MRNLSRVWIVVWKLFEKIFKGSLLFFIAAYRTLGTTHLGGACRFEPSCSAYALETIKTHHSHKALWLITKRICKCRPGGPYGYDPVPPLGGKPHAAEE
jgi:putative membrane protein insertion efficiency factor